MPLTDEMRRKMKGMLKKEGAVHVAVFGSYARGEEREGSDIDVLVRFSHRKSLLDLVRIERELSEELGIKVELLTEKSISPHIMASVEKDKEVLMA